MSGGKIRLRPLSARQELEVLRRAPSLLPYLMRYGLELDDALALAGNACLVHAAMVDGPKVPFEVLEAFSLSQIAALCEALEGIAQPIDWEIDRTPQKEAEI